MANNAQTWRCERCGASDNATRYHNTWTCSVHGETSRPDEPDMGECVDALDHDFDLCDACTRKAGLVEWILARALETERKLQRCGECMTPLNTDGTCPICHEECPNCGKIHKR